eukprot:m.339972 g.339972  ORF g.339972 m.339972 type:complete len:360 (-) comp19064_c0_seq1:187-1266(-)
MAMVDKGVRFQEPQRKEESSKKQNVPKVLSSMMYSSAFEVAERQRFLRKELFEKNLSKWKEAGSYDFNSLPQDTITDKIVHTLPEEKKEDFVANMYRYQPWKRVVQVDNLLTSAECKDLIERAHAVGFMSAREIGKLEFPEYFDNENNKRIKNTSTLTLVEDNALAQLLWKRIQGVIECECPSTAILFKEGPMSSDDVVCTPVGVCPLMRVLRYEAGQQFLAHTDGVDYYHNNICDASVEGGKPGHYRSFLTLAVYLNDSDFESEQGEFSGGALHFVKPPTLVRRMLTDAEKQEQLTKGNVSSMMKVHAPYDEKVVVHPKAGRGALFHQVEHHEAFPLTSGIKYMIQTSIMFEFPYKEQ